MDREGLINLPGRPEEQAWLHVRLGCADRALSGCIDLERYGRNLLKQKGYTQTADGRAYILGPHAQIRAPMQMQQM